MIQLNHVRFAYQRKRPHFSDVSLSVEAGTISGLLGKNGAGKTTLLKLMAGLLHPASGTCVTFDSPAHKRRPGMLAKLFFIPEEFQLPPVSISRFVTLHAPFYPHFDAGWFHEQIGRFGLSPSDRLPALSFGQRKKVLIAFGLAANTRLLLLDEPTNGLDIPSKGMFRKMVAASMREDRAILISTHQVKDVENLIDRVVVLDEGRIVFEQSMQEVSRCLEMTHLADLPDTAVYHERGIAGYTVVQKNETGVDSAIDLELLFNTILTSPDAMHTCFQGDLP
ncbi:ATP-binding cassette domain-containing protein [Desulfoluna sp.]|uniref:ABC transporter ATP-binding protein n=1 Tax=Desulfoluna sp. TaxID=2045199 RepID=UPI002628C02B|nr:ABC transporter ATP-binding protein [Desulfoluna sp.]